MRFFEFSNGRFHLGLFLGEDGKQGIGVGMALVRANLVDAHAQLFEHLDVFKVDILPEIVQTVAVFTFRVGRKQADLVIVMQCALIDIVQTGELGNRHFFIVHLCFSS